MGFEVEVDPQCPGFHQAFGPGHLAAFGQLSAQLGHQLGRPLQDFGAGRNPFDIKGITERKKQATVAQRVGEYLGVGAGQAERKKAGLEQSTPGRGRRFAGLETTAGKRSGGLRGGRLQRLPDQRGLETAERQGLQLDLAPRGAGQSADGGVDLRGWWSFFFDAKAEQAPQQGLAGVPANHRTEIPRDQQMEVRGPVLRRKHQLARRQIKKAWPGIVGIDLEGTGSSSSVEAGSSDENGTGE